MMSRFKFIFFSSFYGLLDILSGTELNPGQRETGKVKLHSVARRGSKPPSVQTAKESCELLLKVVNVDSDNLRQRCLMVVHAFRSSTPSWTIVSLRRQVSSLLPFTTVRLMAYSQL